MEIQRWSGAGAGRSHTVAYGDLVWTVANASDSSANFAKQVAQSLEMLDAHLKQAGSDRTRILSLQVMLTNIADRDAFDAQWQQWIGPRKEHWPQRACFQSTLAADLLVELVVVAALRTVS